MKTYNLREENAHKEWNLVYQILDKFDESLAFQLPDNSNTA